MSAPTSIFAAPVRTTTTGLLIVITVIAFEDMAVSTALPSAARELHGLTFYGLAFTGFLVSSVVGMVAAGQQCDRRGPARPLFVGLVGFMIGLSLAGTATTMEQLVVGRVVQGVSAGLMITAVYVVVGEVYSEALRPKVFAATSSAWVVPSLVGPLVSGTLAQHVSWRVVFLGLVPFTLVGAALTVPTVRRLRRPARPTDGSGRMLVRAVAVALGIGVLGVVGDHPAPALLAATVPALVLAGWGLRALLPAGTMRVRPGVSAPIALRGLLAGAFFGVQSLVPLMLSVQHAFTPTAAGLPLAVSGVSWAVGSWWQGRAATDRDTAARRTALIRTGFCSLAVGIVGMALTALPVLPGELAYPSWLFAGLGMGLAMSSLSVVLLRCTTDARRGADSAALQLSDATASAVTTGVGGVLVAAAARGTIGYTPAFVVLGASMCAVALLGAGLATRARPASGAVPAPLPAHDAAVRTP